MFRILILLLIAFICGSIGAGLAGKSKKGCLINIALGFIGALLGGWLSRKLQVGDIIVIKGIPVIWSIIGAALFVAFLTLISGDDSGMEFAYEIDAGLGYAMTEAVHWSVGWRFVDMGTASMDLVDTANQPRGDMDLDLSAHEFTTSLRFTFWRVPFLEGE